MGNQVVRPPQANSACSSALPNIRGSRTEDTSVEPPLPFGIKVSLCLVYIQLRFVVTARLTSRKLVVQTLRAIANVPSEGLWITHKSPRWPHWPSLLPL